MADQGPDIPLVARGGRRPLTGSNPREDLSRRFESAAVQFGDVRRCRGDRAAGGRDRRRLLLGHGLTGDAHADLRERALQFLERHGSHADRERAGARWHAQGADQADEGIVAVDQEHPGGLVADHPEGVRDSPRHRQVGACIGAEGSLAAADGERAVQQVRTVVQVVVDMLRR